MSAATVVAGRAGDRLAKRMRRATARNRPLEGPATGARRALREGWQDLVRVSNRRDRLVVLLRSADEAPGQIRLAGQIAIENDIIAGICKGMDALETGTSVV